MAAVTEPRTATAFAGTWANARGVELRCLGAGCRSKALLGPIAVKARAPFRSRPRAGARAAQETARPQVYAVALYVPVSDAARELASRCDPTAPPARSQPALGRLQACLWRSRAGRQRGGLFADVRDDSAVADALLDGTFMKALHIVMARSVDGATFASALREALEARMRLAGATAALDAFAAAFAGRQLETGAQVFLIWRPDGVLEVRTRAQDARGMSYLSGGLHLRSANDPRALHFPGNAGCCRAAARA